jgi:hypothetical protein
VIANIIFPLVLLVALTTDARAAGPKELPKLVESTAYLATVPQGASHTNEDWGALKRHFPNATWLSVREKEFTDAKSTTISKGLTVSAYGARTMIRASKIELFGMEQEVLYKILKNNFKVIEERCDTGERASFAQRYALIAFKGAKPVRIQYEISAGSGGITEALLFDNNLALPAIGSEAIDGKWSQRCK